MMHLFDSIAYDVAVCMSQLFEYYFYAVFNFFTSENVRFSSKVTSILLFSHQFFYVCIISGHFRVM